MPKRRLLWPKSKVQMEKNKLKACKKSSRYFSLKRPKLLLRTGYLKENG